MLYRTEPTCVDSGGFLHAAETRDLQKFDRVFRLRHFSIPRHVFFFVYSNRSSEASTPVSAPAAGTPLAAQELSESLLKPLVDILLTKYAHDFDDIVNDTVVDTIHTTDTAPVTWANVVNSGI